jgi:hypothetical protein
LVNLAVWIWVHTKVIADTVLVPIEKFTPINDVVSLLGEFADFVFAHVVLDLRSTGGQGDGENGSEEEETHGEVLGE